MRRRKKNKEIFNTSWACPEYMLFDKYQSIDRLNLVDNQHLEQKKMDLAILFLFLQNKFTRIFSKKKNFSVKPESKGKNLRLIA
jgi:hypothetical protein